MCCSAAFCGDLGGAGLGLALGLDVDLALTVDGQSGDLIVHLGVSLQLDDRAGVDAVHQRHLFAGHQAAACDHADLTGQADTGGVLVRAEEVRVFAQLRDLLGVDEQHLVGAAHLLLKQVNSIDDGVVADLGLAAVVDQACGLQGVHAVIVDLGGNGLRQLGVGLAHRVAVAGQHGLVGQADALHSLFDGGLAGGGGHFFNSYLAALGHVGGIANVGVGGHGDGIARHARQGIVDLSKRCYAQFFRNPRRNHIRHHFRIDHIGKLRNKICHGFCPFLLCTC